METETESYIFTYIRNLDMEILQKLDDHHLYDACRINNYAKSLCNDENFWRNRYMKKFSLDLSEKPPEITWKEYYLERASLDVGADIGVGDWDRLYYLTPSAKLFFNVVDLGDYLGIPLTENLIEKAGISSKNNLKKLLYYYSFRILGPSRTGSADLEKEISNIFSVEYRRLGITDNKLSRRNIDKLVPLLLSKPLGPSTLYLKISELMLYEKEKQILSSLKM